MARTRLSNLLDAAGAQLPTGWRVRAADVNGAPLARFNAAGVVQETLWTTDTTDEVERVPGVRLFVNHPTVDTYETEIVLNEAANALALEAVTPQNWGSLAAGTTINTSVPCPGAKVGDLAVVGVDVAMSTSLVLTARVDNPNVVTVICANISAGAIDPPLIPRLRVGIIR